MTNNKKIHIHNTFGKYILSAGQLIFSSFTTNTFIAIALPKTNRNKVYDLIPVINKSAKVSYIQKRQQQ